MKSTFLSGVMMFCIVLATTPVTMATHTRLVPVNDDIYEKSSLTRLLLSYLENLEDLKTMAAFQTVGTK